MQWTQLTSRQSCLFLRERRLAASGYHSVVFVELIVSHGHLRGVSRGRAGQASPVVQGVVWRTVRCAHGQ